MRGATGSRQSIVTRIPAVGLLAAGTREQENDHGQRQAMASGHVESRRGHGLRGSAAVPHPAASSSAGPVHGRLPRSVPKVSASSGIR